MLLPFAPGTFGVVMGWIIQLQGLLQSKCFPHYWAPICFWWNIESLIQVTLAMLAHRGDYLYLIIIYIFPSLKIFDNVLVMFWSHSGTQKLSICLSISLPLFNLVPHTNLKTFAFLWPKYVPIIYFCHFPYHLKWAQALQTHLPV